LHKTQPRRNRQAAPSPSQAVLESWNDIGRKLVAIAEDLPEDKYDYKPSSDSRTFAATCSRVRLHVFLHGHCRGKRPVTAMTQRDELQNQSPSRRIVKKCVPRRRGLDQIKGDKGLNEESKMGGPNKIRLYDLAYGLIEHSGEHYGQLVVYYRTTDWFPLESRPKK